MDNDIKCLGYIEKGTGEKETDQNTKVIVYDDYNSRVRCDADVGTIGAITTNIGASALRNGYKLIIAYG